MNHTCSAKALLVGQLLPAPVLSCPGPLGSECSQGQDGVPRAGMLPQHWVLCQVWALWVAVGVSLQHREGDAVETPVLLLKCFPNINRCPCPLIRISVRNLMVEARTLRQGEGTQVRQTPCGCQHPAPCVLI